MRKKMDSIDEAIINALKVNMGHKKGESVAIVKQDWSPHLGEDVRPAFEASRELCERMFRVFYNDREFTDVLLTAYVPEEARDGADATEELYRTMEISKPDIIFMPTVYSLSHTPFREAQTKRGARIASLPGFTLEMFDPDGSMVVNYREIDRLAIEFTYKPA